MPRYQNKRTVIISQDKMSALKPSNSTTLGLKNCNIAEALGKDFKTAFINMLEALKDKINKSILNLLKTQKIVGKMQRTVQDLQDKIESVEKIQNE